MKARYSLWPRGFTGRVTLVLLFAVVAQFVAGSLLVNAGEANLQRQDLGHRIAEQLLVAERIVAVARPEDRARLLATLSTHHIELELLDGPPPLAPAIEPAAADIGEAIVEWEPSLAGRPMLLAVEPLSALELRQTLTGAIAIDGGLWIGFRTLEPIAGWALFVGTSLRVGIVALIVLGTAALLVRTLSAPLRRLSQNARQIGTAPSIAFEESGPSELREVSHALNLMQERIEGLIEQRTNALAAVGHDLRTPLARLRLRLTGISEARERQAAFAEVDEMSRMLQELLDYFDGGDAAAAPGPMDLASLCQTIAETFTDLGAQVRYAGPERLVVQGHYEAARRAIENLVDNAVKYAGAAWLSLSEQDGRIEVAVQDEGPGIPEEDLERAKLPFERLDAARSTNRSGIGLGLSIVRKAAELHGGRFTLANRASGGLSATLSFPAA